MVFIKSQVRIPLGACLYMVPEPLLTRPGAPQQDRVKFRWHITDPTFPTQEAIPEQGRYKNVKRTADRSQKSWGSTDQA